MPAYPKPMRKIVPTLAAALALAGCATANRLGAANDVHALLVAIRDDDQAGFDAHVDRNALKEQLQDVSALLTPASSALVTIVGPSGAAEVAGVVLDQAVKLAVEDLPGEAAFSMANEPALMFAGEPGAAVLHGSLAAPHTTYANPGVAAQPPG